MTCPTFADLKGQVLRKVTRTNDDNGSDVVLFELETGEVYRLHHEQGCCESVRLVDHLGDFKDLHGTVHWAYEASDKGASPDEDGYDPDSSTWTFYRIGTAGGSAVLRWLGTSNGYYSESVDWDLVGDSPQAAPKPKHKPHAPRMEPGPRSVTLRPLVPTPERNKE